MLTGLTGSKAALLMMVMVDHFCITAANPPARARGGMRQVMAKVWAPGGADEEHDDASSLNGLCLVLLAFTVGHKVRTLLVLCTALKLFLIWALAMETKRENSSPEMGSNSIAFPAKGLAANELISILQ